MKYIQFIIEDYRAIVGKIKIDVRKNSLIPIIGVNECGKTTILHAILAFDYFNDDLNHSGRHLKDVDNLYDTSAPASKISAEIAITPGEYRDVIKNLKKEEKWKNNRSLLRYAKSAAGIPEQITLTRNLGTRKYDLSGGDFRDADVNDAVARAIIEKLPYILYFDDFQDSVDERVEIVEEERASDWLKILDTLFYKTDEGFSVYALPTMEERKRLTILSRVKQHLHTTLTKEWRDFRFDESDNLRVELRYEENPLDGETKSFLRFDIVERDSNGHEHFFFVRDRSKGFFWFFNFVMKLEFNPKLVSDTDVDAIYLLDEPGSYLHGLAQERLCEKLRHLSVDNKVIYCTHSHHLLNPEVIPLNSIRIAEKDGRRHVSLVPIHEHQGAMLERRSAYQPLLDALQIRPLAFALDHQMVILVEGMVDYWLLDMFKGTRNITILPSVGAESIQYYINMLIAWSIPYRALWDHDPAGQEAFKRASTHFGQEECKASFRLLPLKNPRSKKRIIQDLVDGKDMNEIKKQLQIPANTSFDKTISSLYYSTERTKIVDGIANPTRQNFDALFAHLDVA